MLTISQLARYAGVTVRAVRHYHQIGLLAPAERNRSGYRTYDADAVVQLIRIRTLADAGVPLAKVQELLDAEPAAFAEAVAAIDGDLRAEIRRLQDHRRRIALLAAGESLALPGSVVAYLDRLRALGVSDAYIELERDSWIIIAAQVPDQIEAFMAHKHRDLDDPDTVALYALVGDGLDWAPDDPRIEQVADILERLTYRAAEAGATRGDDGLDAGFTDLIDAATTARSAAAERLLEVLRERGWTGLARMERAPVTSGSRSPAARGSAGSPGGARPARPR